MENNTVEKLVFDIDFILMELEDTLHGEDGKKITEARLLLSKANAGIKEDREVYVPVSFWISTEAHPLIIEQGERWYMNEGVPDLFLAALQQHDKRTGKTTWWIKLCVIEDEIGLCVVGEGENEPSGWQTKDVEYWMPVRIPPELIGGASDKNQLV